MRQVSFRLQLFGSEAERASSERILRVLLRALAAADVEYLRAHPNTPALYESGVRYRAERVPREFWKGVAETLQDRHGDCEDLACWRCAELVVRERIAAEPVFRYRRVGRLSVYHILVRYPDGRIEDPSVVLGMGQGGATRRQLGLS